VGRDQIESKLDLEGEPTFEACRLKTRAGAFLEEQRAKLVDASAATKKPLEGYGLPAALPNTPAWPD
jgi:hypothetical protein